MRLKHYEIYFCNTPNVESAFGKYTDYFKEEITSLEQAQHIISSKANGWGHCTKKIDDYTYLNFYDKNDPTYFVIVKEG